jgi:hypothetical protein
MTRLRRGWRFGTALQELIELWIGKVAYLWAEDGGKRDTTKTLA